MQTGKDHVEAILAHVPERRRLPLRVLEQTGMRVGESGPQTRSQTQALVQQA